MHVCDSFGRPFGTLAACWQEGQLEEATHRQRSDVGSVNAVVIRNPSEVTRRSLASQGLRRKPQTKWQAGFVSCRRECVFKPTSLAATGGPPGPTDGGAGNSGGGDGGGDSQGDGQNSSPKNSLLKGWEDRIAADPQFTYKVFVEQVCNACYSALASTSARHQLIPKYACR